MSPSDYSKLFAMPAWVAADKTNLDANTAARHSHANKALLDTYTQSEALLASAVSLRHAQGAEHANLATLNAITAAYTAAEQSKLASVQAGAQVNPAPASAGQAGTMSAADFSKLSVLGYVSSNVLGAAQALNSVGWINNIVLCSASVASSNLLVCGHVTFRNFSGGDADVYFRIRRISNNAIIASGQADMRNNKRVTVGFSIAALSISNAGEQFGLDAMSSVGSGTEVTYQNGQSMGGATVINAISQW
jgi:hypothetical protein